MNLTSLSRHQPDEPGKGAGVDKIRVSSGQLQKVGSSRSVLPGLEKCTMGSFKIPLSKGILQKVLQKLNL
jgi:hypothetical protein